MVPAVLLPQLRRARDLADRRFAEALDLDALAGVAQVSRYHFARCFAETDAPEPSRAPQHHRLPLLVITAEGYVPSGVTSSR